MQTREAIIYHYVEAYNYFDVAAMTRNFAEDILFDNQQNGQSTMLLHGLEAFRQQAEAAKAYFSERQQSIKAFRHQAEATEVDVEYYAVLAIDLPNGLKKGEVLRLQGKSVFEFEGDTIVKLTDIA